jgi:hypothetical protein
MGNKSSSTSSPSNYGHRTANTHDISDITVEEQAERDAEVRQKIQTAQETELMEQAERRQSDIEDKHPKQHN